MTLSPLMRCPTSTYDSSYGSVTALISPGQALAELRLDLGPEALQPHGDCAFSDAHAHGDLASRQGAVQVEEPDGLLLGTLAQGVDHFADRAQFGFLLQRVRGGRNVILEQLRFAGGVLGGLVVRRARGQVAAGAVAGDGEEPGGEPLAILQGNQRAK